MVIFVANTKEKAKTLSEDYFKEGSPPHILKRLMYNDNMKTMLGARPGKLIVDESEPLSDQLAKEVEYFESFDWNKIKD